MNNRKKFFCVSCFAFLAALALHRLGMVGWQASASAFLVATGAGAALWRPAALSAGPPVRG
jgi:hypothetical protein